MHDEFFSMQNSERKNVKNEPSNEQPNNNKIKRQKK